MKLLFLSLLVLLKCASTNQNIYKTIAKDLVSPNSQKTIAVLPFDSNSKEFKSEVFSEKLIHELVVAGNYQVIERSKIDRVLKEQSLTQTGLISQDESIKIGKLVSADGVVLGSITLENNVTTIIARIVDTETGKIWSSSKVSYLTQSPLTQSKNNSQKSTDTIFTPVPNSEKPETEIKDLQIIRNGKFGRFIGLLKNKSNFPISGNKLYINLYDKSKKFLDTTLCSPEKPAEPKEEVPFHCVFGDFPKEYASHEIFFEPENRFYINYTPFTVLSEKFKEEHSGLEGYSLTGILKNDTQLTITYPKIILILYDGNKQFIGSAIGYGNQKKLSPGESTTFKVSAYSYSLTGKPKNYKIQTYALASPSIQK